MQKIRVAIVGSGNIGTDLCERLIKDERFEVVALIGRRPDSDGLLRFRGRVKYVLSGGIESLTSVIAHVDGVFDATSAFDHEAHWQLCIKHGRWIIDLTPSKLGKPMVPSLIGRLQSFDIQPSQIANYSMVTCGGQSSAPILYAFFKHSNKIEDVEVSSSIASLSAGPATRRNIDQYIESTENLSHIISGTSKTKAILVINPATPPVMMRTTVQVRVESADIDAINEELEAQVKLVNRYVPGYEITLSPYFVSPNVLSATAKVTGSGFYLPNYAGNLDIINAAAVETAFLHHRASD